MRSRQAEEPFGVTALAPVFEWKYYYETGEKTENNMDIVVSVDDTASDIDFVWE